ncbi:Epoxyqueuosine reductase [Anoxybacillus sp. BCO1]|nr:Epoxyqueuosine reductase [Anoxybacillus sp. BCO1]
MAREKTDSTECDHCISHYKDESAIDDLFTLLREDSRPVIRGTAAWALGKIGNRKVVPMLQQAKQREQDEDVIREIEKALAMFENV